MLRQIEPHSAPFASASADSSGAASALRSGVPVGDAHATVEIRQELLRESSRVMAAMRVRRYARRGKAIKHAKRLHKLFPSNLSIQGGPPKRRLGRRRKPPHNCHDNAETLPLKVRVFICRAGIEIGIEAIDAGAIEIRSVELGNDSHLRSVDIRRLTEPLRGAAARTIRFPDAAVVAF